MLIVVLFWYCFVLAVSRVFARLTVGAVHTTKQTQEGLEKCHEKIQIGSSTDGIGAWGSIQHHGSNGTVYFHHARDINITLLFVPTGSTLSTTVSTINQRRIVYVYTRLEAVANKATEGAHAS